MRDLYELYPVTFYESLRARGWRTQIVGEALMSVFQPKSVVDVGCGSGELVQFFEHSGIRSFGIEGTSNALEVIPSSRSGIFIMDLRLKQELNLFFDLALCFNVAEHIDPEYDGVFVENLTRMGRGIAFAATFGPIVSNHAFNMRPLREWEEKFNSFGFFTNVERVEKFKRAIGGWRKKPVIKFIVDNFLYLEKG